MTRHSWQQSQLLFRQVLYSTVFPKSQCVPHPLSILAGVSRKPKWQLKGCSGILTSVYEKEVGAWGLLALLLQLPLNPSVVRAHSAYSQRSRGERMVLMSDSRSSVKML